MSKQTVAAETLLALGSPRQCVESYENRELTLGTLKISRALPVAGRRMIGAWCFLDRFGPLSFSSGRPMDVAPHPHMGLQTVTWLLEGEVAHDDSLRSEALLRPGGVNVMTSGHAIAHAERTPADHSGRLNGVQLWTALPDHSRHGAASFQHVAQVPVIETAAGIVRVFSGTVAATSSPARHFSELLGADLTIHPGESLNLPLEPTFEHGILVLEGDCALEDQPLAPRLLHYVGHSAANCRSAAPPADGFCSLAARHSPSASSCGGTSWPAPPTKSATRAKTGSNTDVSEKCLPMTDRDSPRRSC